MTASPTTIIANPDSATEPSSRRSSLGLFPEQAENAHKRENEARTAHNTAAAALADRRFSAGSRANVGRILNRR